jgi:ATP dependent DNA ligase domain
MGRSIFKELLYRRGNPVFYAFDLLWLNGRDPRQLPLLERKRMLRRLVRGSKHCRLMYAHHVESLGRELFGMICGLDLEGIVAKHKDGLYLPSAKWIKIKNPNYTQAEGRHELFESLRFARRPSLGRRRADDFVSGVKTFFLSPGSPRKLRRAKRRSARDVIVPERFPEHHDRIGAGE